MAAGVDVVQGLLAEHAELLDAIEECREDASVLRQRRCWVVWRLWEACDRDPVRAAYLLGVKTGTVYAALRGAQGR